MNIEPIGIVKSPVTEAVDENWGNVVAEIHLLDSMAPGLQGIEQFSHLIVVFFMHQSTFDLETYLARRPRGRADMPVVGAFAQRARHRPNPIGVTAVELLEVRHNVVKVRGLDAIDGTPVVDLKPYLPAFDCRPGARIPEWVERLMKGYF
ncbi:MAG: tRNA (N6-threonylcarbamoyladenosine(37)-N6)-methyltransferase TrmO [Deltaproteobacteria bacterium]|nr:tRNA (N6-threonylcarbamoyladenosine(37)-N6)-methyltransferase TrmO [Deltaproteobacteria bacterium]